MGREKVDVVGGKRMGVERGCESILGGKARSGRRGLVELDWDSPKACGASSTCTPLEATVAQSGNYVTCHRRESASSSNNSSSGRSEVAWLRCCCLLCMKLAWERCSGAGGSPVRAVESHPRCLSTLSHAHMHTHMLHRTAQISQLPRSRWPRTLTL